MSPTHPAHRTRVIAALLVGVLVFAACGKSSSPSAKATTTTAAVTTTEATTTTEAPTTTTTEATTTTLSSDLAALKAKAQGALLKASDLGTTFADDTYSSTSTDSPCGTPDPDKTLPPAIIVGSVATNANPKAALQEEIRIYQDEAEGTKAFVNFQKALDCTSGSIDNGDGTKTPATIGTASDIKSINTNISEGYAKSIKTSDFEGEAVVARLGAAILTLQFVNAPGADTSTLPDPQKVVNDAVTKAAAA